MKFNTEISHYEEIANKMADLIEKNEAPWQKEWESGAAYMPYNIKSGKEYQGINMFMLLDTTFADPRWLTYKQANELGGKVRAGEKGQKVVYFQTVETIKETDNKGNEIEATVLLTKPKAFWSTVFNAEQCENIPLLDLGTQNTWNPIHKAQEVIDKSNAVINHKTSSKAFYNKNNDTITLPRKEQFPTAIGYYKTALHELGHWTGSENRLNRFSKDNNSKQEYAKEELVAEITSFMVGSITGLGHEPNPNTIAYLKSWSKAIRDDPKYLVKACQEADKATKFLLGDLKRELNQIRENIAMAQFNNEKENIPTMAYINVPIKEKDEAKALGAKWDKNVKSWFVPEGKDINLFQKWEKIDSDKIPTPAQIEKHYIAVPYNEKDQAKALGAKWDKENQSWYCKVEEKDKFSKWFIQNTANINADIPIDPKNEFLAAIKQGGILDNELIADGKKQRIAVEGDKGSEKSGFYVLHNDGVPNGYFFNNRTGQEIKWVQKGYILSNEDKKSLQTVANAKKAERKQEELAAEKKAVEKLNTFLASAKNITEADSIYFQKKQIQPTKNTFISPYGDLVVPLTNIKGNIVSAQYINSEGSKRFARDTQKSGAFHLINGNFNDLSKSQSVILTEGYSTANTIYHALNRDVPVVAAMGAANIENTVAALKERFTDINIIIAADNDLSLKSKGLKNVGLETAKNVAEKYEKVSFVVPKLNNKNFDGDFNDLFVKNENKVAATKNIANIFKKELQKEKTIKNEKSMERTAGIRQMV